MKVNTLLPLNEQASEAISVFLKKNLHFVNSFCLTRVCFFQVISHKVFPSSIVKVTMQNFDHVMRCAVKLKIKRTFSRK